MGKPVPEIDPRMKIIAENMEMIRIPDRDLFYMLRPEQEFKSFIEQCPESDYIPMVRQFLAEIQKALITVERIEIRGNRRVPEDTILGYINTESGQPYSRIQLDSDIGALYKAGYFDYIEIEEKDGEIGKIITFIVEEKPIIRSIEYAGNNSFTESDILNAFRKNRVGLTVDSQYEHRIIRAAERVLKNLMVQHGKPKGTVRTQIESIPRNYIRVHFILDESGKESP